WARDRSTCSTGAGAPASCTRGCARPAPTRRRAGPPP
ncbi:MAG: hypothetical protein AVDCRST_MAG35-2094, partial [uncultured Quadrisphaera sp.]